MRNKILRMVALTMCMLLAFCGCASEEADIIEFTIEDSNMVFAEFSELIQYIDEVQDGTLDTSEYSAGATMKYFAENADLANLGYLMYFSNEDELTFDCALLTSDYISLTYMYDYDFGDDNTYTETQQYMMTMATLTLYVMDDAQYAFDAYTSYAGVTVSDDGTVFTYPMTDGTAYLGALIGSMNDEGNLFVMYIPATFTEDVMTNAQMTAYVFGE